MIMHPAVCIIRLLLASTVDAIAVLRKSEAEVLVKAWA